MLERTLQATIIMYPWIHYSHHDQIPKLSDSYASLEITDAEW